MDSSIKRELCKGSITINQSTPSIMISKCTCNTSGLIPCSNIVCANSIEFNNGASLSDDSGVPLTTNSSISSGDSFHLGMCKYEIEEIESDGEASQFDSLENFSEGGMSAENCNTLKKGPLAPIDPPPEFQDSPKATLLSSFSNSIVQKMRRWSLSQSSFENSEEAGGTILHNKNNNDSESIKNSNRSLGEAYSVSKHLYSSDSVLNILNDNIYDEPNNIISTSVGTRIDIVDSECSLPSDGVSSHNNGNQLIHPPNQEYNRALKSISCDQNNLAFANQICDPATYSFIHHYGWHNGEKKTPYHYENTLRQKISQSQLGHIYQYHARQYEIAGINSCGNLPYTRSLGSRRLSSSYNSLGASTTNKADDSIFITQAMSHDALLTRDIYDFYNVPIDSDIYAFPIDMIKPEVKHSSKKRDFSKQTEEMKIPVQSDNVLVDRYYKYRNQKSVNRTKRRKRLCNESNSTSAQFSDRIRVLPENTLNKGFASGALSNEPQHMTLDEVRKFCHSFYFEINDLNDNSSGHNQKIRNSPLNGAIWHSKVKCKTKTNSESSVRCSLVDATKNNKHNENINNNDTNIVNHNYNKHHMPKVQNIFGPILQHQPSSTVQKFPNNNKKLTLQADKKSQFTQNFKQKFCSIFRFRKSGNRCRGNSTNSAEYVSNDIHISNQTQALEGKGNKFQSRALPPLPKKAESRLSFGKIDEKPEFNSYHFTSSIEKVKDYGWYWGPLSSEAAEKVLSNEPDGSFIVRDSSDDHYIFSLSFKLNNCVRHVRIEQDQGTFSFGSYAKFKSQTITEFIEKAVEHSRSGRYLFFLHRRPEHGPLRVQLVNPVSRFKHVQSLQHMCRFIIVKAVIRKDLIQALPLPRRLLDYLNYKHCYSEEIDSDNSSFQISNDVST